MGLTENTIVIFQSDNGHSTENSKGISVEEHTSGLPKGHYYLAHGGGGNTGKWIGSKGSFLEGGIRVPAIVSCPAKLPKGEVRDQAVTVAIAAAREVIAKDITAEDGNKLIDDAIGEVDAKLH